MPHMIISIMNIFNTPDKLVTVKKIVLMIEFSLFTLKCINRFIQLFLRRIIIQTIDDIIYLNMMFSIWVFEYTLSNMRNYTYHPTIHSIISIDVFISFITQLWYDKTYIVLNSSVIIWWWLFFITLVTINVPYIGWWRYV